MPKRPPKPKVTTAAPLIPEKPTLGKLREAAEDCKACPLWKPATQTVFGEGSAKARVMIVGEVPGDKEDLAGHPFVGPAGALLDKCLEAAGIDRAAVYVTNVVKHFKFEEVGKRRIHQKPNAREVTACKPWLEAEIDLVKPEVIVLLGATAAQALLGRSFRVTEQRGEWVPSDLAPKVMATYHPSALLRAPDPEARRAMTEAFTEDLRKVAAWLQRKRG